jgi:hypothetical protein
MDNLYVEGHSETTSLLNEKPAAHDKLPYVPKGISGILFYVRLSSFWFAYSGMMGALPSVVWPSQIEVLLHCDDLTLIYKYFLGPCRKRKEGFV